MLQQDYDVLQPGDDWLCILLYWCSMKTKLLTTTNPDGKFYNRLRFVCPGCVAGGPKGYEGIHELPVNAEGIVKTSWDWDGNLETPTLSPSILSQAHCRCHSFLRQGVFEFLSDSDHSLAGQFVPLPDLPEWAEE